MFSAKELDINNPAFEDRLMWDFASATYTLWYYDGIESYPEEVQELEEAYGGSHASGVLWCCSTYRADLV
jgi:hypothetical protein